MNSFGRAVLTTCLVLSTAGDPSHAATEREPLPSYSHVTGTEVVHDVQPGETLERISQKFGVRTRLAMAMNRLGNGARLKKGQKLRLSNRRIIPLQAADGVVVNLADLTLSWVQDGQLMAQFPVAVGREEWETPVGHYEIVSRRRDPVWHVPPSIQREMQEKGLEVKTKVLAGPDNPLGKYWLQLSAGGIGIHGTNHPWTVGKYATHGCIRLRANDIEWLYFNVRNGTTVDIVDEPVKFARLEDGTVLMEAHPLRKQHERLFSGDLVPTRLQASGLSDVVDSAAVARAMRDAWGVAVDVTRKDRQPGDFLPDTPTAADSKPAPRADKKVEEPRASLERTLPSAEPEPIPPRPVSVAVQEYQRPSPYVWSGGRPIRVARP